MRWGLGRHGLRCVRAVVDEVCRPLVHCTPFTSVPFLELPGRTAHEHFARDPTTTGRLAPLVADYGGVGAPASGSASPIGV